LPAPNGVAAGGPAAAYLFSKKSRSRCFGFFVGKASRWGGSGHLPTKFNTAYYPCSFHNTPPPAAHSWQQGRHLPLGERKKRWLLDGFACYEVAKTGHDQLRRGWLSVASVWPALTPTLAKRLRPAVRALCCYCPKYWANKSATFSRVKGLLIKPLIGSCCAFNKSSGCSEVVSIIMIIGGCCANVIWV